MSFFDTEEAHTGMLAHAADRGTVDHRPSGPGSSGKSRLNAPAQPALVNGSLLFLHGCLNTDIQQGEVQKKISISLNRKDSVRVDAHYCFAELR
jgi:hypothetical protein